MPEIDFNSWPLWLIVIWMFIVTFRNQIASIFPTLGNILGAQIESKRHLEEMEAEGERQDELALWSSMVHLQTEAIRQNEKLLDFIIRRLDQRLIEMGETIKQELGSVRHELSDMTNRWLVASKEASSSHNEVHLLRNEIVRLIDKMEAIERHIIVLTTGKQVIDG